MMSKSFVSNNKKMINKLNMVKLTPILDTSNFTEDTFKSVPLINQKTGEVISIVLIKFWQSNSSSLSSTINQGKDGENETFSTKMNIHTPIYHPIYFFVQSISQIFEFLKLECL